jgi:hypothetical protein
LGEEIAPEPRANPAVADALRPSDTLPAPFDEQHSLLGD